MLQFKRAWVFSFLVLRTSSTTSRFKVTCPKIPVNVLVISDRMIRNWDATCFYGRKIEKFLVALGFLTKRSCKHSYLILRGMLLWHSTHSHCSSETKLTYRLKFMDVHFEVKELKLRFKGQTQNGSNDQVSRDWSDIFNSYLLKLADNLLQWHTFQDELIL